MNFKLSIIKFCIILICFMLFNSCNKKPKFPESSFFEKIDRRNHSWKVELKKNKIFCNNIEIKNGTEFKDAFSSLECPPTPKVLLFIDKNYPLHELDTLISDLQELRGRIDFYLKVNIINDSCFIKINFPMRFNDLNYSDSIHDYIRKSNERFVVIEKDSLDRIVINNDPFNTENSQNRLNQYFENDTLGMKQFVIKYNPSNTIENLVQLENIYRKVIENQKQKFLKSKKVETEDSLKGDNLYYYETYYLNRQNINIIN